MKWLVTGGNGFIGSHVVDEFFRKEFVDNNF
jgi:nucleoside-diphosphate-sugar epimerase